MARSPAHAALTAGPQPPEDPRGHRRPAAALPAQPARGASTPGDATISSERLAELAGVNAAKVRKDLSYLGLLRHPRRRLRRRVPAVPDEPRARPHPGLAGRHRRPRQPRPGARQLRRASATGASRSWRSVDADPRVVGTDGPRRRRSATSTTCPAIAAEHGIAIGIIATPAVGRPGRGRPAGRGRGVRRSSTSPPR